ncbi:hypothetical protein DSO57_1015233 [Entomophthora muscae]|uniref:Uncharacterized protein n=1 Tax=Entomophthora muscae TaxID=34485 RepID=A0ACC2TTT1_9FUNG|nr:hypothetical protein DSO57_1015233 [Entomophthora muscae]
MESLRFENLGGASLTTEKSLSTTAHEYGVHDTMRFGFRSIASELVPGHSLEAHLNEWDASQFNLKLNIQRQVHGLHMPFRALMERDIIGSVNRHPMFKSSRFGLDILDGKDETIDVEDFLNGILLFIFC